jgi:hypothetical protein
VFLLLKFSSIYSRSGDFDDLVNLFLLGELDQAPSGSTGAHLLVETDKRVESAHVCFVYSNLSQTKNF